jgi:ketosteroid isomerase-like protein
VSPDVVHRTALNRHHRSVEARSQGITWVRDLAGAPLIVRVLRGCLMLMRSGHAAVSVDTLRISADAKGFPMRAGEPGEASTLFERCFAEGDLDGLMSLYEGGAVFPTPHGTSTGHDEIRATLKAYIDSGAKLAFGESLVFAAGDLALIHTPWTMRMPDGSAPQGATAEVVRRQSDGSWKYVIDNPDGTALLDHG